MTGHDTLEHLEAYYRRLDSIPTPALRPKQAWHRGLLTLALAPFGAALIAYGFIYYCASGPITPARPLPVHLSIDQYALDEIRPESPNQPPIIHASLGISGRRPV
jgi:hypothetical protein